MARANLSSDPDHRPSRHGDWQDLREELMGLLDRLDSQVADSRREPIYGELGRHMHADRQGGSSERRSDALRSVQRAMDRFSLREDETPPLSLPGDRERLRAALETLRPAERPRNDRPGPDNRNEIAMALDGVSERLDRLDDDLRRPVERQESALREIADQVAQLAQVVELLAGAVGETAQVKRLEAQIARLSESVEAAPQAVDRLGRRMDDIAAALGRLATLQQRLADQQDSGPITTRLDDVSATLGRLAALQVEARDRAEAGAVRTGSLLETLEGGLRNIYDRVDSLERQLGAGHPALDAVVADLREITLFSKAANPASLLPLIESLGARVDGLARRLPDAADLKASTDALKNDIKALLPRLDQIDDRLTGIENRLPDADEPTPSALMAQLAEVQKRLDSNGRQLTALAQLTVAPDYDLVADKLAQRTQGAVPRLADADLAAIEERLNRVLDAPGRGDLLSETLSLRASVRLVSERLDRLESGQPPDLSDVMPVRPASVDPLPVDDTPLMPLARIELPPVDYDLPPAPEPSADLHDEAPISPGFAAEVLKGDDNPDASLAAFAAEVTARSSEMLPEARARVDHPLVGWAFARLSGKVLGPAERPLGDPVQGQGTTPAAEAVQPGGPEAVAEPVAADTSGERPAAPRVPLVRLVQSPRLRRAALVALLAGTAVGLILVINSRLSSALTVSDSGRRADPVLLSPAPLAETRLPTRIGTPGLLPAAGDPIRTGALMAGQVLGFVKNPRPAELPTSFERAPQSATGLAASAPSAPALLPPGIGPIGLIEAAGSGNPLAAFDIAGRYGSGDTVPEDAAASALWYQRAAEGGIAPAAYRLGSLYETGRGVPQDPRAAERWYRLAAEAGNRPAMHNLAVLYSGDALGSARPDLAARWFEAAAQRGMTDSQYNLGALYARGLGVTADIERAYYWFGLAARRNDADAEAALRTVAAALPAETRKRLDADISAFRPEPVSLAANFAPDGLWDTDTGAGSAIDEAPVVKGVQRALAALGFRVIAVNGVVDRVTAEAIRGFERALGMPETGAVTARLLKVLASQPV